MAFIPQTGLTEFTLVSVHDPAIDRERSDMESYERDYSYNPTRLVFHAGQQPTQFVCRPLSHRLVARLLDVMMHGTPQGEVDVAVHEAALMAFRYGVADIRNLSGFDPARHVQRGNPPVIKESWLDTSPLPVEVVVEIGAVILARARLGEGQRKN